MELSGIVRGGKLKGVVSCKGKVRMSLKKQKTGWVQVESKLSSQKKQLKAQTGFFVVQGETSCVCPRSQGTLASEDDGRRRSLG